MQICSFCSGPTAWAVRLPRNRYICPGCKPLEFMRRKLRLPGDYGGETFKPLPWFEEFVRAVYGRRTAEGYREVESAYLELAKGNAKTTNFAALIIEALCSANQSGFRIVSAASVKDQAAVLYEYAEEMIYSSPDVLRVLECVPSKRTIYRRDNPSINYRALSSDGRGADGKDPAMVIRDELHLWKTESHKMLYNVLEKSAKIKRKNPLIIDITTAGEEDESPLCYARHVYTMRVNEGIFHNPRFYGRIYGADAKRMETDPDYWTTKEAFLAANPSHEDLGGFIRDTVRQDMVQEAIDDPSKRRSFLRYHLNYWGTFDASVIDWPKWRGCDGGVDLASWKKYDVFRMVSQWNLLGKTCYLGLDIGSTSDMTSLVALFPPDPDNPRFRRKEWAVLAWYWMPKSRIDGLEKAHQVPYREWVNRGFIFESAGARTDPDVIIPTVKQCSELFHVVDMGYDPANADHTITGINEQVVEVQTMEVPQRIQQLNGPTKWLLDAYQESLIIHGNHPVLSWNARNLALVHDSHDNVMPMKAANKTSKKIDGISALVCSIQRSRTVDPDFVPYHGLRTVGA